jgi:hypothetical protein
MEDDDIVIDEEVWMVEVLRVISMALTTGCLRSHFMLSTDGGLPTVRQLDARLTHTRVAEYGLAVMLLWNLPCGEPSIVISLPLRIVTL